MKILIISPQYSSNHWSGMGRSTVAIARGLVELGHAVYVYSARKGAGELTFRDNGALVTIVSSGVGVIKNLLYEEAPLWNANIVKHWSRRKETFDAVVLQDWYGASAALHIKNETGTKLVLWMRSFSNGEGGCIPFAGNDLVRMYSKDETQIIKAVDVRVTGFARIATAVKAYCGVDVGIIKCSATSIASGLIKHKIRSNGKILMVGKVSCEKGYERIIRALPKMPWANVVMVGPGRSSDYGHYLSNVAVKEGVDDRIAFAGWKSVPDLLTMYGESEMVVCPNLFDGFGYSLFDAQSMGLPVAGYASSYSDYISHEKTGMIFQSVSEVIDYLSLMNSSVKMKAQFVEAGLNTVAKYTELNMCEELITAFSK